MTNPIRRLIASLSNAFCQASNCNTGIPSVDGVFRGTAGAISGLECEFGFLETASYIDGTHPDCVMLNRTLVMFGQKKKDLSIKGLLQTKTLQAVLSRFAATDDRAVALSYSFDEIRAKVEGNPEYTTSPYLIVKTYIVENDVWSLSYEVSLSKHMVVCGKLTSAVLLGEKVDLMVCGLSGATHLFLSELQKEIGVQLLYAGLAGSDVMEKYVARYSALNSPTEEQYEKQLNDQFY